VKQDQELINLCNQEAYQDQESILKAQGGVGVEKLRLRTPLLPRDERSLLFLTPLLLRQIQLRLQFDSENFSNIILQLHSDSKIFKVWEINSDVKITFHPSVIFFSIL